MAATDLTGASMMNVCVVTARLSFVPAKKILCRLMPRILGDSEHEPIRLPIGQGDTCYRETALWVHGDRFGDLLDPEVSDTRLDDPTDAHSFDGVSDETRRLRNVERLHVLPSEADAPLRSFRRSSRTVSRIFSASPCRPHEGRTQVGRGRGVSEEVIGVINVVLALRWERSRWRLVWVSR